LVDEAHVGFVDELGRLEGRQSRSALKTNRRDPAKLVVEEWKQDVARARISLGQLFERLGCRVYRIAHEPPFAELAEHSTEGKMVPPRFEKPSPRAYATRASAKMRASTTSHPPH